MVDVSWPVSSCRIVATPNREPIPPRGILQAVVSPSPVLPRTPVSDTGVWDGRLAGVSASLHQTADRGPHLGGHLVGAPVGSAILHAVAGMAVQQAHGDMRCLAAFARRTVSAAPVLAMIPDLDETG